MKANGATQSTILIVNADKNSATALYRAHSAELCLRRLGFTVSLHQLENIEHIDIHNVSACIFIRTPLLPEVSIFVSRLRSANVTVVADFDDLIFRPDLLHLFNGGKYLPNEEAKQLTERSYLYQEMIRTSDYVVGTTIPLTEELSRFNKNAVTIRNYPLEIAKSVTSKINYLRLSTDKFVVGYYSGTLTHQADFKQCAAALADLLNHCTNVELRLVGKLSIEEFPEFSGLESRIAKLPLLSYENMLFDLATCHVNLAPLEVGNLFCECKSELKYFDAALVRVPTIASPTAPYRSAIKHGVNGYLATTRDEWFNCLHLLKRDSNLIERVGLNARRYAVSFFGEAAQLRDYRSLAMKCMGLTP